MDSGGDADMIELFTLNALVFYTIGLLSMTSHAIKKWVAGEIRGNLIDWYVCHPRMTVGAVMACFGGIATAILSGALDDYSIGAQIIAAWGIGYAADSVNNQGKA
jgi:hypothetical protein